MRGDDVSADRLELFDEADGTGWIIEPDIVSKAIEIGDEVPTVENSHGEPVLKDDRLLQPIQTRAPEGVAVLDSLPCRKVCLGLGEARPDHGERWFGKDCLGNVVLFPRLQCLGIGNGFFE